MSAKTLFAESGPASVAPLFAVADQTLQGVEQLARLNLQTVKTVIAEFQRDAQAALSAQTPDELLKLQTAVLQAIPQKATAYTGQVRDIVATATAAAEAQIAELQTSWMRTIDGLMKDAPGSESALALLKSALSTANNAYESVNKASKQASDAFGENAAKLAQAA